MATKTCEISLIRGERNKLSCSIDNLMSLESEKFTSEFREKLEKTKIAVFPDIQMQFNQR